MSKEEDKFKELQPEPPVLQAPPPPPPPPPPRHPIFINSMTSSSVREQRLTHMGDKMVDSPVLQLKQSPPPPLPQLRHIRDSLQSAFKLHKASPPPPLPHSANEISPLPPPLPPLTKEIPLPIPEQQLQLDTMHPETEEKSYQYSIDTLPQVSWRTCSVPARRHMRKSEVAELSGAFEKIQSRSLGRMEHEPLLGSLDKMEEKLWIEDKFKELQPESPVLQAPPPPPPLINSMRSSSVREQRFALMGNKMMDSPVLQQKQSPPPPLPQLRHIRDSLQSAFKLQKASPPSPPLPHSAKEMSPLPPPLPPLTKKISLPIRQQQLLLDTMHPETEEKSYQYSIDTLPQVSQGICMGKSYQKSEVAELTGAFEKIQSRSLDRMEHEPLLGSLDIIEESLLIEEDMLGEAVTTDLGQYGIGVNVECIAVRPMRRLPDNTIECIMKLQKEDGHWEFDADLERILSVDKNLCLNILFTSGLKSMGESTVRAISQLAASLMVLFSIYKHLFPSSHMTNLRQVDEQNNTYNKIRTTMSKLGFGHQIDSAIAYCNRMKRQYSMVPATLELGKSWEEIVGKMLGIHCEKYINRFY